MLLLLLVVFVSFVSPCDFSAKSLFVGCETWEKDTRNFFKAIPLLFTHPLILMTRSYFSYEYSYMTMILLLPEH